MALRDELAAIDAQGGLTRKEKVSAKRQAARDEQVRILPAKLPVSYSAHGLDIVISALWVAGDGVLNIHATATANGERQKVDGHYRFPQPPWAVPDAAGDIEMPARPAKIIETPEGKLQVAPARPAQRFRTDAEAAIKDALAQTMRAEIGGGARKLQASR